MAEGKTVVTENGLKALIEASSVGKQIKPAYFKVSEQDIGDIYPGINIADLPAVWYQAPISAYVPVNDSTVQFILDIPQDKATKYGKTFGLYLEDGTLFAVAKPPYPFPPLMRQRFRVQFVWEQIDAVMNFEDIPFYEFDQDVVHLDAVSTITLALFDVQEHLVVLDQFKADYYRFKDSTSQKLLNHEERISLNEQKLSDHELAILDMSASFGNLILENSLEIGLLKQYIGG
ncbi:phage tail-collar fiber domain-containing protein [Desulfurobacterium sp.]